MKAASDATLVLTPAADADLPFLEALYATTRADEMALVDWTDDQKAAFLQMQFAAQHAHYHERSPNARYDLVVRDGRPIGRLYVDVRPTEIRILDITLVPEQRGQGLGTRLIRAVMDEAARSRLPVTLHVENFNPARHLYERLGYTAVPTDGVYLRMRWESVDPEDGPATA